MSKTSRKSLPTVLLALCLLIAQAALLAHPSTTQASRSSAATVGGNIFANPGTSTFGAAQSVTITGTGFSPNGTILIAFNAPYSTDGSPFSQRTVPPAINRPGDNRPLPPETLTANYPNVILLQAQADINGNLVSSNPSGGPAAFTIPANAVDGVYEITAFDTSSGKFAATQYTIQRSVSQALKVTPVSGSSAQIEGIVNVTAIPGTFDNGDQVAFYLEDFTASASFTAPVPPSFGAFNGLIAPAVPRLPLRILNCGTTPVTSTAPVGTCQASINGDVSAEVQIQTADTVNYPCVLSTYYFDQVYAIVAEAVSNPNGLPIIPTRHAEAGFHLDHGFTAISLSTNQQAVGSAFVVHGTGFGALAQVQLYFVPLAISGSPSTTPVLTGLCPPPGPANCPGFFASAFPLGTLTTDANGSFTQTVSISALNVGGTSTLNAPGFILAEDFSRICPGAPRLNEAATAAVTLTGLNGTGTLQIGTASIAAAGTTATAAVSSTVTVTGTGFLPNEAVNVIICGALSTCSTAVGTVLQPGAPVPPPGSATCASQQVLTLQANASGVATGSFIVPENCNTVTVISGRINGGSTVTVSAVGQQSGLTDSNTLIIPPTAALIALVNGIAQTGVGIPVVLTGSGFAANEPVTFQFGAIDPFSGLLTTPVLSISGTSDAGGNVTLPATDISGSLAGGLYTLVARGLASSFTSNVSVAVPFIVVNGNLNCPTSVLPGQPFTITGSNFAASTPIFATLTAQTPQVPSQISPTLPAPIVSTLLTSSATGTFIVTPTVPLGTAPGKYILSVTGLVASASGTSQTNILQQQLRECIITVGSTVPAVQANPTSGPIGTTVAVTGQGFGPNEPIAVSLQYYDVTGALTGTDVPGTSQVVTNTDANGNFSGTFVVKSSVNALIPGQYNLAATGQQTRLVARTPFIVTGGPGGPPVTSLYFAEGFTGTVAAGSNADFTETLSILNANNFTTTYTVTYLLENVPGAASTTKVITGTLGASSVTERSVNTDVGLNQKVAAVVTSPAPLAAERIIARANAGKTLDASSSLGQLLDLTATAPTGGFNYYFASGEVQLTNEEYLTLLNPTSTAAAVTVTILPQAPISSTTLPTIAPITVSVPGNSRVTVPIRADLVKSGAAIQKFGMVVNSNVALASERVEYYGDGIGSGKYGAATKPAGTAAFRQYIFSSNVGTFPSTGGNATVGTGNDLSEVDVINPGPASGGSATVTVSFFTKSGAAINSQQVQVDGGTRETISVNDVVGTQADVFSVIVTSDKNVYVEKPVFYGGDPNKGGTHAVAAPSGSPAGLISVAFPYLDLTSPAGTVLSQTVFLYNPGATAITVRGTYVSSGQTVVKTYTVAPNSITSVSVNADAAALPAKAALGAIFQVVQTGSGQGDSFVASVTSNAPDFSVVIGNQGTYPIGAATGS